MCNQWIDRYTEAAKVLTRLVPTNWLVKRLSRTFAYRMMLNMNGLRGNQRGGDRRPASIRVNSVATGNPHELGSKNGKREGARAADRV